MLGHLLIIDCPLVKPMKTLYLKNRKQWREWLEKNHSKQDEIWLIYYKKHTKKPTIPYQDAVEEAICFGWIDGKVRSIDDEKYMQRYTPRRKGSIWSLLNKKRAQKMIKQGKMTKPGLETIKQAKKNGNWQKAYSSKTKPVMPLELKNALKTSKKASENLNKLTNSQQNQYITWIAWAKTKETREKRVKEVIKRLEKGKKPGIS